MLPPSIPLFLFVFGATTCAYKILVIHPSPSLSHQLPAMALTEALVEKGHEVFVLSPNVVTGLEKNYTFVDISLKDGLFFEIFQEREFPINKEYSKWDHIRFADAIQATLSAMFASDTFQQFYKRVKDEDISFDLVLIEALSIPFAVPIARLLSGNKPVVSLSTLPGAEYYYEQTGIGNIVHLSYSPSPHNAYTDKMSLWERLDNWISHHHVSWRMRSIFEAGARSFFRENFGKKVESFVDGCWSNVSFSLISSNALYYYPRAMTPNVVEVGSLHIKTPPEKLPQILQDWLDGAELGVIYFSLGGNMRSIHLHDEVVANFLRVYKELPKGYRVLWKWESDDKIPGQPDNLLTQQWLPQQSVLAHPKVKVFVTQGGCQSFQETVHYGVPTVGIPWAFDQRSNVVKMVDAGIGVRLLPRELKSFEKVKAAIEAVLFDERYRNNMRTLSGLTQDFTSRARDTAVFWVEYVAKHGGASHFRPQTADTSYFQFFCLDILCVILAMSLTILFLVVWICKYVISTVFSLSKKKRKSS